LVQARLRQTRARQPPISTLAMATVACVALLLVQAVGALELPGRRLSYATIAGYAPGSDVTQHNLIDLDQQEMESHLGNDNFTAAGLIYNHGGNSGAHAEITLVTALAADAAKSVAVTQAGNNAATGTVKSLASAGATMVKVTYTSTCKEGGLSQQDVTGCFTMTGGNIVVGTVDIGAPSAILNKYRTLAGFSTAAEAKMRGQEYYQIYRAYYGNGHYSHTMVTDALAGTGSCSTCDAGARKQFAKKSSAFMGVWMYVIREMEDALQDCANACINCNDDPVHAWDEAVAFYTGSLEGATVATATAQGSGKLLHQLADKRCANFGTCDSASTNVNTRIFAQWDLGRNALQNGRCIDTVPVKRRVVELMSVPLVQGSLRYAYKVAHLSGGSVEKAEGAVFSAAILPRIAACDASAATLISDNMAYTAATPMAAGYPAVKQAFESVYSCLGITCEDVGGLISTGTDYYEHAAPCVTSTPTTATQSTPVTTASGGSSARFLPIIMILPVLIA